MKDEAFTVLAALGCTLAGGILFAVVMFTIDAISKAVRRFAERRRLRSLRVDDTWENSPWRDM
ncbi:hypothetical protein ATY81_12380 [Rhizobium sp. R72]|uniref:hypothetical protein n=1 Tax=unclassified Rhizobium TaxID=2613769 RepID=UPI000B52D413|nr:MULTISPECIES: hypothetical protein [unclassified Rhizobium]OWV94242.1 hypothetical protein ATY81_12380 [Rhizobium sp. R72]OWV94512.1 hypothetical protein ATY80_12380 [Rhizobium sp. R711]